MRKRSANKYAESFGLIDEIRILAENNPGSVIMSPSAKREERVSPTSTSQPHFLITTIGGRYLAFEAELVQGVLTNEEVGLPLHDPVVQGIPYRAIDLVGRLNLPCEWPSGETSVVLLAYERSRGSVRVQKVHGVLETHGTQVLSLPVQFRGPERRWYRGMILFDRSVALVLNTAWVFEERIEGVESSTVSERMPSIAA